MPLRTPRRAQAPRELPPWTPPTGLPPWLRHSLRTALHLATDAATVTASYYLAYLTRFHWRWWTSRFIILGNVPDWSLYLDILYGIVPLWLMIFGYSCRLYTNPWISLSDRFLQIMKGCFLGAAASMVAAYTYERLEYSRMMLVLVLPAALVLVPAGQVLVIWFDRWLSRHEAAKPVLLVGGGLLAGEITARIHARHPGAAVYELAELPAPGELAAIFESRPLAEVILLSAKEPHARVLEAAELCDSHGAAFKMIPDLLELRLGEVQMDASLGLPAYRIQHTSLTRLNFLAKRTFDVAFSLAVLAAAALPWALIALLIKLDSKGPVLYRQKRYGIKGRTFEAYKFRTMMTGAEARVAEVQSLNDQPGGFFKAKADPRITGIGRWLRRFSLDEFPQFLNVIDGDMSVVGPRPLAVTTGELEELDREFGETSKKRMSILPGITGLWQVSGRSDVSSAQRFALDLFYIEHWSLGLDLEIILRTIPAMLTGKGAY